MILLQMLKVLGGWKLNNSPNETEFSKYYFGWTNMNTNIIFKAHSVCPLVQIAFMTSSTIKLKAITILKYYS